MGTGPELRSARLLLRRWREEDLEPLAAMNADPRVMEFFPAPMERYESARMLALVESAFEERGYGLWALEIPGQTPFAGFVGLAPVDVRMPFAPAVEVGWRLAVPFWGRGYATEGGAEAIRFAFEELGLDSLVAFTAAANTRSRRVMERLRMTRDPAEDFRHPGLAGEHPLAPHVLHRARSSDWLLSSVACAGATRTRQGSRN
ncbi:MAG TPA: GNAT family N-acetyltransferase [Solirubrobacteraceae bacterium]